MPSTVTDAAHQGRLEARPSTGVRSRPAPPPPGFVELGPPGRRAGVVHVPPGYRPDRPAPLLVLLHGAGADGRGLAERVRGFLDALGAVVLAPDSRGPTWDALRGGLGPDVAFLDAALAATFERFEIDPARVAIAGFSDGASYALTLGLANGDLFAGVLAFSPGFFAPPSRRGAPRVFVSHGSQDRVLPIERCGRPVARALEAQGYDVRWVQFEGGHAIPADVARDAVRWIGWSGTPSPRPRASGGEG